MSGEIDTAFEGQLSTRAPDSARASQPPPIHARRPSGGLPMLPDQAVLPRAEGQKIGHYCRKGSRLRQWIDTPAESRGARERSMLAAPAHPHAAQRVLRLGPAADCAQRRARFHRTPGPRARAADEAVSARSARERALKFVRARRASTAQTVLINRLLRVVVKARAFTVAGLSLWVSRMRNPSRRLRRRRRRQRDALPK